MEKFAQTNMERTQSTCWFTDVETDFLMKIAERLDLITGLNVANIRQEFGLNPLLYGPTLFSVKKKDITEIDQNNMDLLGELLQQKHDEIDPDTILELEGLINNICQS